MGRAPCCSKVGLHRGPWTSKEDKLLTEYIKVHGEGHWRSLPKKAGLLRCGKSCRLRWMNYLRPDIKRGNISADEEDLIIRLHWLLGNRWSLIAGRLPGRTDNEIKNYWNTHLSKRLKSQGTDPKTHKTISKPTQEPQKRKKNNNKKKQKKKNKSKVIGETKEIKIHLPKPIRVTSFMITKKNSFDSSVITKSFGGNGGEKGATNNTEILGQPWYDLKVSGEGCSDGGGVVVGDEYHDLFNSCDPACDQSHIPPTKDNMLEKFYEEYLQLIDTEEEEDQVQLDSFAESLLM